MFRAPVYAGDFLEVRARLTEVGNTSRKMEFQAVKQITRPRRAGWLRPPWMCWKSQFWSQRPRACALCRKRDRGGIAVDQTDHHRRPHRSRSNPRAAAQSAHHTGRDRPGGSGSLRGGSSRRPRPRPAGRWNPTQDREVYREIQRLVAEACPVIFQPSTGGAVWHSAQERLQPWSSIRKWPL